MSDNKARIRRRMSLQDAKAKPLTEADVRGRAGAFVDVRRRGVVVCLPRAHLVVAQVARVVDGVVAVADRFGDDFRALRERSHGAHVAPEPVAELGVGHVIDAVGGIVLDAGE